MAAAVGVASPRQDSTKSCKFHLVEVSWAEASETAVRNKLHLRSYKMSKSAPTFGLAFPETDILLSAEAYIFDFFGQFLALNSFE